MASVADAAALNAAAQKQAAELQKQLAKLPRDEDGKIDLAGAYTPRVLANVSAAMVQLEGAVLSEEARFGLSVVGAALSALGTSPEEILKLALDKLADLLSELCDALVPVLKAILDVIPIIGAVIGAVLAIVQYVFDAKAADTQAMREECRADIQRPVYRIGETSSMMPSDIFACTYQAQQHDRQGNMTFGTIGSLLGDTLRVVTGDSLNHVAADDLDADTKDAAHRRFVAYSNNLRMYKAKVKELKKAGNHTVFADTHLKIAEIDAIGLSEERCALYSQVRRAIECQSGAGDGGAVMWLVYQDLLVADDQAKTLTYDSMQWLCNYRYSSPDTDSGFDGRYVRATNNVTPGSCAQLAEVGTHSYTFGNATTAVKQIFSNIIEPRYFHSHPQTIQDKQAFSDMSALLMEMAPTLVQAGGRKKVAIYKPGSDGSKGSAGSAVVALAVAGAAVWMLNKGR